MKTHYLSGIASAAILLGLATASPGLASSHREAPGITKTPKVDGTDFYMFRSYEPGREGFVTLIANYQPLESPYGGPNYFTMDPDAIYEIHIDNDGDANENLTFQFKFSNALQAGKGVQLNIGGKTLPIPLRAIGQVTGPGDADLGETESYSLTMVTGDRRTGARASATDATSGATNFAKPLDNTGLKTIPNYPAYAKQFVNNVNIPGCGAGRVFVGQRAEAFAVNLGEIFDLVNLVPIEGDSAPGAGDGKGFPGGITQSRDKHDELIGKANVTSIALEVPISCLKGSGNGVIGGWTTASLPQARLLDPQPSYQSNASHGGAYVQVSRLSHPLVNELVIGLPDKDKFNASKPNGDSQFADYVTNPTFPAILDTLFRGPVNATLGTSFTNLAPTNLPRNDLVATFLTGIEGLNKLKTVTASEMMRLNTGVNPTPRAVQSPFGVAGDDLAGYPNGRRPGDDVVDITLRVAMGRLCHPVPISGKPTDLGLCKPSDAVTGTVPYTDGAPLSATDVQNAFPYLNDPIPGSPGSAHK
jgi:hypothetical protein